MPPLPAGLVAGGRRAVCIRRPTSAWRRRGGGGAPPAGGPLDVRAEEQQLAADASSACAGPMVQSRWLSGYAASPNQNAGGSLKRRQPERLLPAMVFEDELPDHVYLGKRVLHLHANGEEARRLASEIEEQLTEGPLAGSRQYLKAGADEDGQRLLQQLQQMQQQQQQQPQRQRQKAGTRKHQQEHRHQHHQEHPQHPQHQQQQQLEQHQHQQHPQQQQQQLKQHHQQEA
ncbi:hypothetical protein Emed_006417 [Eimeria media]